MMVRMAAFEGSGGGGTGRRMKCSEWMEFLPKAAAPLRPLTLKEKGRQQQGGDVIWRKNLRWSDVS